MSENLLQHNLNSWRRTGRPDPFGPPEADALYRVEPSKSGLPTLMAVAEGTERALHSRYDPAREARNFVAARTAEPAMHYVLYGLGLGYFLEALIDAIPPEAQVLVIESRSEIARLAFSSRDLSRLFERPGMSWLLESSPAERKQNLQDLQMDFSVSGYVSLAPPALISHDREYYQAVRSEIDVHFQTWRVKMNTQQAFSRILSRNILDNLPAMADSGSLRGLRNGFLGSPAIVVSAGPSLDKNLHLLRSASSRAVILAVPTALSALLNNGIEPDFTVALDPNEISNDAFDMTRLPPGLQLLYNPAVPARIPEAFTGRRWVMDSEIYLYEWLADAMDFHGGLGDAPSVAHAAVQLAAHLGCNPIILVGQDLSFSGNRLHCSEAHFTERHRLVANREKPADFFHTTRFLESLPAMKPVRDLFGRATLTTQALASYNHIFEQGRRTGVDVFNATEGGVPIPHIPNVPLREIIHSRCHRVIDKKRIKPGSAKHSSGQIANLSKLLRRGMDDLNHWAEQAAGLASRLTQPATGAGQEEQLRGLEAFLKEFLQDSESCRLVQSYATDTFIDWLRETCRIRIEAFRNPDMDLNQRAFERDRAFALKLEKDIAALARLMERARNQLPVPAIETARAG